MKMLMKKVLCAMALMLPFAACTPENVNPADNNGSDGLTMAQVVGVWQSTRIMVNGEEAPVQMSITMNEDGSGYLDDVNDLFHYSLSGMQVIVSPSGGGTYTFTVESITDNEMVMSGDVIPGTDQQMSFKGWFQKVGDGDNPNPPDQGDLGIGTPELLYSTANSITVSAHITGSVSQYLYQFPNYTCGLIWCPAYDGTPSMSSNIVDCTEQARQSEGFFEGHIANLHEESEYNVAAWLRLSPDSEPIISDVRTYSTDNTSSQGDTNWINLLSVMPANGTTLSVTITAFFDGSPVGIGVVYNTTGNPTVGDNLYNGFEHINMETGETDSTIQRMVENSDGSRTVAALINNLQPGTTYHVRGYMQFTDGTVLYSTTEETATTPAE